MGNGVEPKTPGHLLLGQVRLSHVDHDLPVGFNKPVGRLAFSRGCDNSRVIVDEVFRDRRAEQSSIAIAVKAASEASSRSLKEA